MIEITVGDCGCSVSQHRASPLTVTMNYCSMHNAANEMYKGLKASLAALEYVEKYYMPSYSAASEMWSFVNGYVGSPDIWAIIAQADGGE